MMKIYGCKLPDKAYINRPGAYGVAIDSDSKVAIVKVPYGYHLPGGGVENGEPLESCLKREFFEETGYSIEIDGFLKTSGQFAHSKRSGNYYELIGHFFLVTLKNKCQEPIEHDHNLVWHSVDEAVKLLSLEYQADAVRCAIKKRKD